MGPDPMAKKSSTEICQPAYCDAMQALTGWSLRTRISGSV